MENNSNTGNNYKNPKKGFGFFLFIRTDVLIKYKSGSIHDRATWVHSTIDFIPIRKELTPPFGWVYDITMTGKVDITLPKRIKTQD